MCENDDTFNFRESSLRFVWKYNNTIIEFDGEIDLVGVYGLLLSPWLYIVPRKLLKIIEQILISSLKMLNIDLLLSMQYFWSLKNTNRDLLVFQLPQKKMLRKLLF